MRYRQKKEFRRLSRREVAYHPVAAWSSGGFLLCLVGMGLGYYYSLFLLLTACLFFCGIALFLMFLFGMGVVFFKRLLFLLMAVPCFVGFVICLPDVPAALYHTYCYVEGVPTNIDSITNKYGDTVGATVSFYNTSDTFDLHGWDPDDLYGRWIEIHYLPHTGFLVDSKVLSYTESWRKSGLFKQ